MNRIEKLEHFIAQNPKDLFSRHALAMELIKNGQYHKAVEVMEVLLGMDESHVGTYYHLGKLLEKMSAFDKALHIYRKGIVMAEQQNDLNNLRELKAALMQLEDELDA